MEKLRILQRKLYEQVIELEQTYKREVEIRTKVNACSINRQLFFEILEKFQGVLEKEFLYLTRNSIGELKDDMVSSWLADCLIYTSYEDGFVFLCLIDEILFVSCVRFWIDQR